MTPPPAGLFPDLAGLFGGLSPRAWWAVLVVTLLLAGGHLASMLSTRWGDRGTGPKSLLFSVICHLSLICLVLAVKPSLDAMLGEKGDARLEQERRFQIGSVRLDAAEDPSPDRVPEPWRSAAEPTPRAITRSEVPDRPIAETPRDRVRPEFSPGEPAARVELTDRARPDRPAPDRPDEAPAALAAAAPGPSFAPAPVAAPTAPGPEPTPEPVAARSRVEPGTTFLPIPRRDRVRPESADAAPPPVTLTERSRAPAPRPRRDPDDAPPPVAAPVGPTPGGVAAAPPVPLAGRPPDDAEPEPRRRRTPLPTTDPLLAAAGPRRSRVPLPSDPLDLPAPVLTDRIRDRVPRVRDADEEGPRAVVTSASPGPAPAPGVPDAYRLRDLNRRSEIAKRYGGTAQSEEAVEAALAWFARAQEPAGFWDGSKWRAGRSDDDDPVEEPDPDKRSTGRDADAGLTGLVTLTFLGAGYTRTGGQHAPTVDRAVRWLVAQQADDGSLSGEANYYARMYSHGIAAYALAEALALEGDRPDPALRRAVARAVDFTVAQQYPDGGWRYSQRFRDGDMSMFGWQCMALKSAENAGIPTPPETRARMVSFVRDLSLTRTPGGGVARDPNGGLSQYKKDLPRYGPAEQHPVKPSMTAEALFCKQILGLQRDQAAAREAVAYIRAHPPELRDWDLYYWYYATLALHEHGGPAWAAWNGALRDLLLSEQYQSGPEAGTWPIRPNRFNYSEYGGTLYSTALATLCLEVYYRFSPARGGAAAMDGRPDGG